MKKDSFLFIFSFTLSLILQYQHGISRLILPNKNYIKDIPSRSFPMIRENSTLYIGVHVGEGEDVLKMMVSFHKSATLLPGPNCLTFEPYDCSKYHCKEYPEHLTQFEFPYFTAEGYQIETDVEIGDHNWFLNTETIFALNCSNPGKLSSYGNGTSGMIGLGIANRARNNFKDLYPIFSIFFVNETHGEFSFTKNLDQAKPGSSLVSLFADNNWQILDGNGIQVGHEIVNFNKFPLIFDPNENLMSLPLDIFNDTIAGFNNKKFLPIRCPNNDEKDWYRPVCKYHGAIDDLPNITLLIQGKKLVISPWQYVEEPEKYNDTQGNITLNLRATLSYTERPENFVIPLYKGHIILGYGFLKNYLIVFIAGNKNNSIEIYEKAENQGSKAYLYWILGALLTVFIVIILICIKFRCNSSKDQEVQVGKNKLESTLTLNDLDVNGRQEINESMIPENPNSEISNSFRNMAEDINELFER